MPDILDAIGILYVLINYLVLLPFVLYSVHRYEQKSRNLSNSVITFRDKNLIYLINGMILIRLLIERPLQLGYHVWMMMDSRTLFCAQILAMIVMGAILILFTIKVYHLYFKHRYSLSVAEMSWRTNINPNDTNWYILHKNTFGNPMFLVKWSMTPYSIFIIIDVALILTKGEGTLGARLVGAFITFSLLTVAFIAYWKIRTFDDAYNIRQEILFQLITITLGYTIDLVMSSYLCRLDYPRLLMLLSVYFSWIGVLPLSLSSLWYPLYLINRNANEQKKHATHSPRSSKAEYGFRKMKLVIADEQYFKAFMQYLVESLCCENLLFIVELVQVKLSFQERNNDVIRIAKRDLKEEIEGHEAEDTTSEYVKYDFKCNGKKSAKYAIIVRRDFNGRIISDPESKDINNIKNFDLSVSSNCPQTIILDECDNPRDAMKALYSKYIKLNSDHELNISYEIRQKLIDFFEAKLPKISKDNDFSLYSVLDEACFAILHLMYEPFQSFLLKNVQIDDALNVIVGEEPGEVQFEQLILVLDMWCG